MTKISQLTISLKIYTTWLFPQELTAKMSTLAYKFYMQVRNWPKALKLKFNLTRHGKSCLIYLSAPVRHFRLEIYLSFLISGNHCSEGNLNVRVDLIIIVVADKSLSVQNKKNK